MTDIGVVHLDLLSKGGGEAVAVTVLEALQDDYDLTLITATDPDIDALNDYFDTAVDPRSVSVRPAGRLVPWLHARNDVRYYVLQNALLGRYARAHASEFDLMISTINELGLPAGSIEYVHFPFDWTVNLDNRDDIFHPGIDDDSLYERVCTRIAGVTGEDIRSNTVFANSEWTATVFEDAYGTRPEVLHPPINTDEFVDRPWSAREPGFVTVGRIERSKRIVELIDIVDRVRDRGHDVHLHVIGPTYDRDYYEEVRTLADQRDHVFLEGELPRSELVDTICAHRYGLHGKEFEHFGMAVAELAAGGAIPFVPASGGQHAIVRDDRRLLYTSQADAVDKIDAVLSNRTLQRRLRMDTDEIERRFGRDRFKSRIRSAVGAAVQQSIPARPVTTPARDRVTPAND